jgi:hypothetical protein
MKKRYIRENSGDLTAKELAIRLDVSKEFVYETLRSENTQESLFQDATES